MRTEDGYIINKCLNGDTAAFGVLVDKYKESIYALAYSKLLNFQDAEEITQDVFLKAYNRLHTLKWWDSFLAWLYSITFNLCKDFFREQAKRPDCFFVEDQDEAILDLPSIDSYEKQLVRESLNTALDSLPEMYRQVLTLHYFAGMKTEEIAQFLRASPDAIRKRLSRARAKLKEEMLDTMSTTFEEQKLQPGFTFHIVEMVKRMRVKPAPKIPQAIPIGIATVIAFLAVGLWMMGGGIQPAPQWGPLLELSVSENEVQIQVDLIPSPTGVSEPSAGLPGRRRPMLVTVRNTHRPLSIPFQPPEPINLSIPTIPTTADTNATPLPAGNIVEGFQKMPGLAHNTVCAILQDAEGRMWFGTNGGVSLFDRISWKTYTTRDGLADNIVLDIIQAKDGAMWFATKYGGVSRFDGESWKTYTTENGLASDWIIDVMQDREESFWFGTGDGGASRFDGTSWETYTTREGLPDNFVHCVLQDKEGAFWFGTLGGVSCFDGESWKTYTKKDGLADDNVHAIYQDRDGVLWFGTEDGASKFDGTSWETYTTRDGLAYNFVHYVLQDKEGAIWFGTFGGVSCFDGESWKTYTTRDGLADNEVYAIHQDKEGTIWVATCGGGVSQFDGVNWNTCAVEHKAKAPDFSFQTLDGKRVKLSNLKGKVVILNFWATWVPRCLKEMAAFQKLYKEHKGELAVVGISIDRGDEDVIKAYLEKVKVTYPIIIATRKMLDEYELAIEEPIRTVPTTLMVDKSGFIHSKHVGAQRKPVLRQAFLSACNARSDVDEQTGSLQAGKCAAAQGR